MALLRCEGFKWFLCCFFLQKKKLMPYLVCYLWFVVFRFGRIWLWVIFCVCYKSNYPLCWNHSFLTCYWNGNGDYLKLHFLLKVKCKIKWEEGIDAKLIKLRTHESWVAVDEYRHLSVTVKPKLRTYSFVYSNNNHYIDFEIIEMWWHCKDHISPITLLFQYWNAA